MKIKSDLLGIEYEAEDCIHIPNMLQNYKYLNSGGVTELVDIICGSNNRLIFVWRKSPLMELLYDKWCNHEL
jgi:hypothetical protein